LNKPEAGSLSKLKGRGQSSKRLNLYFYENMGLVSASLCGLLSRLGYTQTLTK